MNGSDPTMRQARVLHVLKYYRPTFTGEGVFLERSSAVMHEIAPGVEHHLLVTHTPRPPRAEDAAACSTLRRVIYLSDSLLGTVWRHLLLTWWFILNLRHYDTVHFRTHADWYFITYALTRLAGRRLVLSATLDDSLPVLIQQYRPSLRPWAARGFRLFNAFIGISPKLHAETSSVASDPARCHLVPCGITVPAMPPSERVRVRASLGVAETDPVLLFVGGVCARKDPLFLVEALPRLLPSHPGLKLVLVGPELEPDYVDNLRATAQRLGVAAAVHLAGEQLNPHPWFAAADMLVFASRLEGFGTVVPEAMAHGLPVAVRHLPGVNDDFVLQGETGFLFTDQDGMVDAVLRLAADAVLRTRMGEAGRALARRRFGMRGVAARFLGIYGLADAVLPVPEETPETGLACTASILDPRFHTPWVPPAEAPPLLITTVDAEEAFDWGKPFSRNAVDVSSMAAQALAHRVFERHGVVPIYLTDYPVATQDAGREPLRDLLRSGACEIGAQLHPWVTPPFREVVNEANSYAGRLPTLLELEKARTLTETLAETFGVQPRMFRTGRFGAGPRTADVLKKLGYLVDSSVAPCWPASAQRLGPWPLSAFPHWIDRERTLLEIPVSAALVGRLSGWQDQRLAPIVFNRAAERLGLTGAMAHLALLERIRLSPEGMTVAEAKRLARHMLANGHRVFVLTYHSPSLAPGNTPYIRTQDDVRRMLDWLDEFYTFFREELGGRPASWRNVRLPGQVPGPAVLPAEAA